MIAFIVWIRAQIIFYFFIPVMIYHYVGMDDMCVIGCVIAGSTAFIFGLPGIVGNYLYIRLLKISNVPHRYMLICLLIGFPFIMICCVFLLFLWLSSSLSEVGEMFNALSGFVIAVIVATVLSTLSCHRLLFNYIYAVQNDKVV